MPTAVRNDVRALCGLPGLAILAATSAAAAQEQPEDGWPYETALARAQAGAARATRPVGGREAKLEERPWQVALVLAGFTNNHRAQFCGGAYLGDGWVLTAAHCVSKPGASYEVFYGAASLDDPQGKREKVVGAPRVPVGYNGKVKPPLKDIALLKLAKPLEITPARLAAADQRPVPNQQMTVSGWGWIDDVGTTSIKLMEVRPPIIDRATCNSGKPGPVTVEMLCSDQREPSDPPQDACYGDSGGPATAVFGSAVTLIGVVSWGTPGLCAHEGRISVYTRVSAFRAWIDAEMKATPASP